MRRVNNLKLYIVRHGKTEFNEKGLMQGWCDGPLLEESIVQSQELGKKLIENDIKITKVYSSDSFRTLNTSMQVLKGMESDLEIHHMGEIREFYFGEGEGKPISEVWGHVAEMKGYESFEALHSSLPMIDRVDFVHQTKEYPHAETLAQFKERIAKGLERIEAESKEDDEIMVVAHGLTIIGILDYFGYSSDAITSFDNLSVTEIDVTNTEILSIGRVYLD